MFGFEQPVVQYYGLFIVTGVAAAGTLGYILAKHFKMSVNDYIILAAYGFGGGMVGAKLLYLLVILEYIKWEMLSSPEYLRQLFQGGFVFYGGLIGGITTIFLAGKIHKIFVWKYLNTMIPCLPVVQGFGRIGCYLTGCCYGISYAGPGAISYSSNHLAPEGIALFPVQLLEALLCWGLAIFLFVYVWRRGRKDAFFIYMISYPVIRFFLEFFRGDYLERGIWHGLSTSQWISSIIIILTVICLKREGGTK